MVLGSAQGLVYLSGTAAPSALWNPLTAFLMIIRLICLWLAYVAGLRITLPKLDRTLRYSTWMAATILSFGTILRYAAIFVLHRPENNIFSDMAGYMASAHDFAAGHYSLSGIFQSVTFPLIVGLSIKWFAGSLILFSCLNFIASVTTIILAWRGSVYLLGERTGRWVLLLMAFHFQQIGLAGFLLAETLFGFVIALVFYLLAQSAFPWSWRRAYKIGFAVAVGMTLKGNNFFFIPILMIWLIAWASRESNPLERFLDLAVPFWGGLITVALMTGVYTQIYYGAFQISSTSGALNLVEGKCGNKINIDSQGSSFQSPLFIQIGEHGESVWSRPFHDQAYFLKEALRCMVEDPKHLVTSLRYVHYLFFDNLLWPVNVTYFSELNRSYGKIFTALFWPGVFAGLLIFLWQWRSVQFLPYLLALSIMVCAFALKGELRFRVPFDSVFIPLGVLGYTHLIKHLPDQKDFHLNRWEPRIYRTVFGALILFRCQWIPADLKKI